ncbi:hypothetical protein CCR94_13090 [Rhodoblastus sphagnicola]|uniref:DNA repair photolyase n=1 Tax=Rhodoblastus sphagnicola TaxID=333368 RepID=A0A2S6N6M6_9HYPH|nr:DUF1848 domain-containing protein [Rhodoblastus sphagnicola]MBB4197641.1 DNA repair photolyase [Rhodoblastus sphagnicola]PPQ30251.1 hypothetical protein CCR94_13090 [Rhodoblastus sphagnicola]
MIISASRRTDIPAFYAEWFMNRVREEYLLVRNPFNAKQIRRVSLAPKDVEAIVFWTRNPEKLIKYLDELNCRGHRYYFQYTITGYPRSFERSVPRPQSAIETFIRLSKIVGPDRVIWRFDPILISSLVDIAEHERLFAKIASSLRGNAKRVVISFADIYAKVTRNLAKIPNLSIHDLMAKREEALQLARNLVAIAGVNGLEVQSCSEEIDLSPAGVAHGKCIDDQLISRLFAVSLKTRKDKGQREACGCIESVDIGQYNSCLHGCAYCYATANKELALRNYDRHDPLSPFLIGNAAQGEINADSQSKEQDPAQGSLF